MKLTRRRLKRIRLDAKMRQQDMADRLDIPRGYYAAIERGVRPIPIEWLDGRYFMFRHFDSVEAFGENNHTDSNQAQRLDR